MLNIVVRLCVLLMFAYVAYLGYVVIQNVTNPEPSLPYVEPAEKTSGEDTSTGKQSLATTGMLSEVVDVPVTRIQINGSASAEIVDAFVTVEVPEFQGEDYDAVYNGLDYGRGRMWVKEDGTYSGSIETSAGSSTIYLFDPKSKKLLEKRALELTIRSAVETDQVSPSQAPDPNSSEYPERLSASETNGVMPLFVSFYLEGMVADSLYTLDFGDGTNTGVCAGESKCLSSPVRHTYSAAGTYEARLWISDAKVGIVPCRKFEGGCSGLDTVTIVVSENE